VTSNFLSIEKVWIVSPLRNLRILVVEDEGLVAMLAEDMLTDLGCEVRASAASVMQAMRAIKAATFDLALLDVNLRGESVFPVAEALEQLGVPFVFATGYGTQGVREDLRDHPVVSKPFGPDQLKQALMLALEPAV